MKRYIKRILFLITIISSTLVIAQEKKQVMTLKQAMDIALQNYPQLKAARYEVKAQRSLLSTAFDLGTTNFSTSKDEIKAGAVGSQTVISISQSEIDFLGIFAKRKARKANLKVAQVEVNLTKAEVLRAVETAYSNLLFQQEQLLIYKQVDSIYAGFVAAAKLRYETQESSKLEWLAAEAKRNEITLAVTRLHGLVKAAKVQLNQFLLQDNDFEITPYTAVITANDISLEKNEQIALAMAQVEQSKGVLAEARAGLLPKFNVGYKRQKADGIAGYYGYEVGISIPLFTGQWSKSRAKKAQVKRRQQELILQKLQVKTTLEQKYSAYKSLKDVITYYREKAVPLALERIQASKLAYRLGEIDYVNYIQSIETQLETKLNFAQSSNQYRNVIADLHFISGTKREY